MKLVVQVLQKHRLLALVGMRLVKITGKHPENIHPKHLLKTVPWYIEHINTKDKVLDYGCGNGQHTLKIAMRCKYIIGFDLDEKTLGLARKEARRKAIKNVKFLKHDGEKKLPFTSETFDCVVFIDVLEHLYKRNQALLEINRVLKKSGRLIITVPNVATSWKNLQKKYGLFYYTDPDHKIEFTKGQIESLLKKKSFEIQSIELGMWDTPLAGFIDMVGGISLSLYKNLREIRRNYPKNNPEEADGFNIVAVKK